MFVKNNIDRYHEKLVILITDGAPCNFVNDECPWTSNDLWRMTGEFEKKDITLVVIGIEPSVVVCDDFYCALANKTGTKILFNSKQKTKHLYEISGGEYIPLINASRVLSFVIQQSILGEDTLSQLFRHLDIDDIERHSLYHYSYVEKRARFMNEYCRTMADIRRWLYTYRHRPTVFSMNIIIHDDNDSEPYTPPLNSFNFDRLYSNVTIFSSTPITDDEGYRTRLPTTASSDSSFIRIDGCSPVFTRAAMDLCWSSSEIDDNSV